MDEDVRELTLLATIKSAGDAVSLRDPSSKELTATSSTPGVTWFRSPAFTMVTVKNPAAGRWKVTFKADVGNKVFIVTDLKLCSSFDKGFVPPGADFKVDLWLERGGRVIRDRDVFAHLSLSARVRTPDGSIIELPLRTDTEGGSSTGNEGTYAAHYRPRACGEYSIVLRAVAPTFMREKEFSFSVVKDSSSTVSASTGPRTAGKADGNMKFSWLRVLMKLLMINAAVIATGFCARGLREKIRRRKR